MVMANASRRGGPLIALLAFGAVWVGARAIVWESPFVPPAAEAAIPKMSLAPASMGDLAFGLSQTHSQTPSQIGLPSVPQITRQTNKATFEQAQDAGQRPLSEGAIVRVPISKDIVRIDLSPREDRSDRSAQWAASQRDYDAHSSLAHSVLWHEAMRQSSRARALPETQRMSLVSERGAQEAGPAGPALPNKPKKPDRWFLDVWGFFRQETAIAPTSQGRVPTYGASQSGAKLAYRIAPRSGHDPRVFARVYRALVPGGESEIAAGGSARPFAKIPVRLAGEMRATDGLNGIRFRPAGFAFTELAPIKLPERFTLEAYAQGGYVGGKGATPFADGQALITRHLTTYDAKRFGKMRISLGGGIWGGAQRGASRVDIGPSMRFDMSIGKVPARISLDYRHKIAGDAAPASGVTATVSTQF